MAKGYRENRERLDTINSFGKNIGKRAGFTCEWCDGKEELRIWDYQPDLPPDMETLALLCKPCRALADGGAFNPIELRSIRNALWSDIPLFPRARPESWRVAENPGHGKPLKRASSTKPSRPGFCNNNGQTATNRLPFSSILFRKTNQLAATPCHAKHQGSVAAMAGTISVHIPHIGHRTSHLRMHSSNTARNIDVTQRDGVIFYNPLFWHSFCINIRNRF